MKVTDATVEAAAQAIYESRYKADGGRWECVETKEVWRTMARAALEAHNEDPNSSADAAKGGVMKCAACGSERVKLLSPAEGYTCLGCGASDADE